MKKFLLMAGFAVFATSPLFADGGSPCCNDPRQDPQCAMCEEESNHVNIDICATVNVPLHVNCEDNTITFPCLYRPGYPYNPAGQGGDYTLDPTSGATRASGRLALVDVIGDENDDIYMYVNRAGGNVTMFWQPRPGEVATSQAVTFNVHLLWAASYGGGIFQVPFLDGPPAEVFFGDFNAGGRSQGQPGNAPLPTQLGNDGGGPGGTGGVHIWLGGTASPNPSQQRGFYHGDFDIWADYFS